MKFDVIIGNPPYNSGMDIDFVKLGLDLSKKYCAMIIPAKWQTAEFDQCVMSEANYGKFRKQLVPHIKRLTFFPCTQDVFNIYQVDGVTYILMDKDIHDKCVVTNRSIDIDCFNSECVRSILNEQSLLNIGNEIIEYLGNYQKFEFPYITGTKRFEVVMNSKISGFDWFDTTKPRYILGKVRLLDKSLGQEYNGEAKCIFESDSKEECESFISWIQTRFTRFFILPNISKLNNILTNHCFRFVPAPKSERFDHIYTDDELYKEFKLKPEYIEVIEKTVKKR